MSDTQKLSNIKLFISNRMAVLRYQLSLEQDTYNEGYMRALEHILEELDENPSLCLIDGCQVSMTTATPSHHASSSCQSGKRPHCTCDTCY